MLVLGLFGLGLVFCLGAWFEVNSGFRQSLCEGWSIGFISGWFRVYLGLV